MLFMGWMEETCAGQHHWPQVHRMVNSCILSRDMSLKLGELGACLKRLTRVSEKAYF